MVKMFMWFMNGFKEREEQETESGDSNGWDRLHEVPCTEQKSTESWAGGVLTVAQLEIQLKEALAALTEKTEECEKIQKDLTDKGQELQEREDLLQQVFTELKGLEMQISDYREREENLKISVHRLTLETARKENEIDRLRTDLEAAAETKQELDYKISQLEEVLTASKEDKKEEDKIAELESSTIVNLEDVELERETANTAIKELQTHLNDVLTELTSVKAALAEAEEEKSALQKSLLEEKQNVVSTESQRKETLLKEENLNASLQVLQSEKEQLVVLVNQKHEECLKYHQEAEKSAHGLVQLQTQLKVTQRQLDSASNRAAELHSQVEHLEKKNFSVETDLNSSIIYAKTVEDEKKGLLEQLEQAKSGMVVYESRVSQIEAEVNAADQRNIQLRSELETEKQRADEVTAQLHALDEPKQKADREVQRLMDHLLQVEENYTREAIAAEERETSLRQQLREAEQQALSHSMVAKGTNDQMKDQIEDLKVQLGALAQQRDSALLELAESQEQIEKSQKSLVNLQGVLQHFQAERDSLVMDEVERYKLAAEDALRDKEAVRTELASAERRDHNKFILIEKETEREGLGYLQQELKRKDCDIESLQKQLQTKDSELADMRASASQTQKSQNGKVDKELLKNLFLGYFAAPGDKKNEVAHLLGSVLGFGAEDYKKVDAGDGGSGWLNLLRRQGPRNTTPEHSITAEFIRFLEAESSPGPSSKGRDRLNIRRSSK